MSSILDALLEDSLLNPPVMQQNFYISLRSDKAKGSGVVDDPWNGDGYVDDNTNNQTRFDWAMSQVPENSTVFIGPCDFTTGSERYFLTRGYPNANGFRVRSGQRIVGAGMGVTIIKLIGHTSDAENFIFSMPFTGTNDPFLYGLEISDLTLDANLPNPPDPEPDPPIPGTVCAASGIRVRGKHILIQRLRVQNIGANAYPLRARGICAAYANGVVAVPYDAVIDGCIIDAPSVNHSEAADALSLDAEVSLGLIDYHEACVIRGCSVDGGYDPEELDPKEVNGIFVSGARGTIVENNRIYNCLVGGPIQAGSAASEIQDLIVRDNFYYNCKVGIEFEVNTLLSQPMNVDRVIIENNAFDLSAPSGTPQTFVATKGIRFVVTNATSSYVYKAVIIRNNRIRGNNGWSVWTGSYGMELTNIQNLTVENNVVDMKVGEDDNGIRKTTCGLVQALNNRRSTGELVRVVDTATNLHVPELTTDAEDLLYSL